MSYGLLLLGPTQTQAHTVSMLEMETSTLIVSSVSISISVWFQLLKQVLNSIKCILYSLC